MNRKERDPELLAKLRQKGKSARQNGENRNVKSLLAAQNIDIEALGIDDQVYKAVKSAKIGNGSDTGHGRKKLMKKLTSSFAGGAAPAADPEESEEEELPLEKQKAKVGQVDPVMDDLEPELDDFEPVP